MLPRSIVQHTAWLYSETPGRRAAIPRGRRLGPSALGLTMARPDSRCFKPSSPPMGAVAGQQSDRMPLGRRGCRDQNRIGDAADEGPSKARMTPQASKMCLRGRPPNHWAGMPTGRRRTTLRSTNRCTHYVEMRSRYAAERGGRRRASDPRNNVRKRTLRYCLLRLAGVRSKPASQVCT